MSAEAASAGLESPAISRQCHSTADPFALQRRYDGPGAADIDMAATDLAVDCFATNMPGRSSMAQSIHAREIVHGFKIISSAHGRRFHNALTRVVLAGERIARLASLFADRDVGLAGVAPPPCRNPADMRRAGLSCRVNCRNCRCPGWMAIALALNLPAFSMTNNFSEAWPVSCNVVVDGIGPTLGHAPACPWMG